MNYGRGHVKFLPNFHIKISKFLKLKLIKYLFAHLQVRGSKSLGCHASDISEVSVVPQKGLMSSKNLKKTTFCPF